MGDKQHRTTETLRETLFETIEKLQSGAISCKEAREVAILSGKILETADLELRYAETVDKLDRSESGISPGKLLLTDGSK